MGRDRATGDRADSLRPRHGADWRIIAPLFVLILLLGVRLQILLSGQRFLRSDEAVVGLMAKHIVTRGERPVFLYGQPYGGGHAIVAYLAAPIFALVGPSAIALTGITVAFSIANAVLVWIILRHAFDDIVALAGAALYAFTPPVIYLAFLVNGGTESFFFALLALWFFLRAYRDNHAPQRNAALTGIFCGLAVYAMDYALLYPLVFGALWLATGRRDRYGCFGLLVAGFLVGCAPMILYDLTHDFAHLRHMIGGSPGGGPGIIERFAGAWGGIFTGDLAAFYSGEIDNFKWSAVGPWAWLHAGVVLTALVGLLIRQRSEIVGALKRISLKGRDDAPLSPVLIVALFMLAYLLIYSVSRFSVPPFRTPRYFLPLAPFDAMAVALFFLWKRRGRWRHVGAVVAAVLVIHGALQGTAFGMRHWHEEHSIMTSGADIRELGDWLVEHDVGIAMAPYEIQWRTMFETNEAVTISSELLSPVDRYPAYSEEVRRRLQEGEPCALILRRDLAWSRFALDAVGLSQPEGPPMPLLRLTYDRRRLPAPAQVAGGPPVHVPYSVHYPVTLPMLRRLAR